MTKTRCRTVFAETVRLTGTRDQINQTLEFLSKSGCKYETDGKYYPQRGNKYHSAYYLHRLRGPVQEIDPDEPQPGPYDAVLGGKGKA